jgi:hypothetical protein
MKEDLEQKKRLNKGSVSRRIRTFFIASLALILFTGCGKPDQPQSGDGAFEIEREFKRGPVVFVIKVSKREINIAERLNLLLEVQAGENYAVELPKFGEKLEQFGIVDYSDPQPRLLADNLLVDQKLYVLEPFLSGEYKIPPMQVSFWKKNDEQERHTLESEEISIKVSSLLPEDSEGLQIKEIVPPVDWPWSGKIWMYWLIALVFAAGAVAGIVIWKRRRNHAEVEVKLLPHEIAYRDLAILLEEDLVKKGEIKLFYLRLSNILRHYIENRFGLRAPECTTEEFLIDLRKTDDLLPDHKNLLKDFLKHSDLVKFAAHQPENKEIQTAFDACKQFIVETQLSIDEKQGAV